MNGLPRKARTAAACFLCMAAAACRRAEPVRTAETIRFGITAQPSSALAILCCESGFPADMNLKAEVSMFSSGRLSLSALLANDVDFATCSDVPLALSCFRKPELLILATISRIWNEPCVVARKSAGIRTPADLKGKRILTQQKSSLHFFLDVFLVKNGLRQDDVVVIYCSPDDLVERLTSGAADAATLYEPLLSQASRALGSSICIFREQGLFVHCEQLITTRAFAEAHPGACVAMMEALLKAEAAMRDRRSKSIRKVALALNVPEQYFRERWEDFDLRVQLDQSLLLQLDDIARWAVRARLMHTNTIPNFLRHLETGPLRTVSPDSVSIIQ